MSFTLKCLVGSLKLSSVEPNQYFDDQYGVIIITGARIWQAAGESVAVNRVSFYTFATPWVISVSWSLGE